jgi:hypothetical protein
MTIKAKCLPKLEELMTLFEYHPDTGIITCRIERLGGKGKKIKDAGEIATSIARKEKPKRAWRVLQYKGQKYKAARVAWLLMTGNDPGEMIVDHINGDSLDDRWENLRLATRAENQWNRRISYNNTTGFKGVYLEKSGKYRGFISANGQKHTKCGFDTAQDAAEWIRSVRAQLHGDFYTHRGDATIEPQQLNLWPTSRPTSNSGSVSH